MAAGRSPCRCFKTSVLNFMAKNTPLKDKKWKRKIQRMLSFLFVEEGKLFINKSSFEEFNLVFFTTDLLSCSLKCNQGSEVFAEFSGTFSTLWPRKLRF